MWGVSTVHLGISESNDTHSCSNIGVQSSHCSGVQQGAKCCWPHPLLFFVAPFAVLEDRGGEMMSES